MENISGEAYIFEIYSSNEYGECEVAGEIMTQYIGQRMDKDQPEEREPLIG